MAASLFEEWQGLLEIPAAADPKQRPIGKGDALVVIDMQADFVPRDSSSNPDGGRFGVPEGDLIVHPICQLITLANASGATVVATRDYHPHDHASVSTEGGPFPPHCVQGTPGANLLPPIALVMSEAWKRRPDGVHVAFKAFHEDVDSFGAFPYQTGGPGRLTLRKSGSEKTAAECPMGCHSCPWTGCIVVKQSALHAAKKRGEAPDMNAPPDMLAMTVHDGKDRQRRSLQQALKGSRRLFVCGLALDFCVLDTCLNAKAAGFAEVYVVLDCARAAHIAGIGPHGTGFLTAPSEVLAKLKAAGVRIATSVSVCGDALLESDLWGHPKVSMGSSAFPASLGPLGLESCDDLTLSVNTKTHQYTLELSGALEMLGHTGYDFANTGRCSPLAPLPAGWPCAPSTARSLCWAYPLEGMAELSRHPDTALAFLSLTVGAELRFTAYGGFLLIDEDNATVAIQTIGAPMSGELRFDSAERLGAAMVTSWKSRMQSVTLPSLLRAGAQQFCWLVPGESHLGGGAGGGTALKVAHGAFAYQMKDGPPLLFRLLDPSVPLELGSICEAAEDEVTTESSIMSADLSAGRRLSRRTSSKTASSARSEAAAEPVAQATPEKEPPVTPIRMSTRSAETDQAEKALEEAAVLRKRVEELQTQLTRRQQTRRPHKTATGLYTMVRAAFSWVSFGRGECQLKPEGSRSRISGVSPADPRAKATQSI